MICKWLGTWLGMKTCEYFEMKQYSWRGIREYTTYRTLPVIREMVVTGTSSGLKDRLMGWLGGQNDVQDEESPQGAEKGLKSEKGSTKEEKGQQDSNMDKDKTSEEAPEPPKIEIQFNVVVDRLAGFTNEAFTEAHSR